MPELTIIAGQHSEAGIKESNDDSCGIRIPEGPLLTAKGVAAVIADGMSGSEAGREAADSCVKGFLSDYFSTPDSWTVETSGEKILGALNSWLYSQGHRQYGTAGTIRQLHDPPACQRHQSTYEQPDLLLPSNTTE